MANVPKDRPKHLGRGLAALMNPIISDNPAAAVPVASAFVPQKQTSQTDQGQASQQVSSINNIQKDERPQSDVPKLSQDKELRDSYSELPLTEIAVNPYQPRTEWDQQQLKELADSIKANGLIQPVVVRQAGGRYQLIAGERRFRAAQMIGMTAIPAFIRQASDEQMLELALVENIHRADLNPIERAKAYQNYIQTFNLTQVDAAQRLGEDRSVVSNFLRLLDLPEDIKNMLVGGQLSMGHARAILGLPTDELRRKLANRAMAGRLSVREVERLVKKYIATPGEGKAKVQIKSPHIVDLENRLRRELGTKVAIETKRNGQRGKIVIEFYSIDEFERIAQKIGVESLEEV